MSNKKSHFLMHNKSTISFKGNGQAGYPSLLSKQAEGTYYKGGIAVVKRVSRLLLLAFLSLVIMGATTYAASPHDAHQGGDMTMPQMSMGAMMSMQTPQWDGNLPFDKWFLDNMIPHHQQAVMMSRMLYMHTQRAEMKTLGNDIVQAQMKEIEQMQNWRTAWFNTQPLATHPGMMQGMTGIMRMDCGGMMNMMPGQMQHMMNMDIDLWFINNMISHHQSAIDMATVALKNAEHPEILSLTQAIVANQQKEIDMMKQWKAAWYPTAQ